MPRAGLDRDRVIAAAADLADEVGLAGVSLSALAARVGVRPASLYAHVAGARDLATAVTVLALDEFADLLAAELVGRSGRDALAGFAGVHREFARAHPGRYAAGRAPLDPSDTVEAVRAGRRHSDLARAVLRGYGLPEAELVHAVRFLAASVHGFTDLESTGAFGYSDPGPQESWDRLVDVLDVALRHWPTVPAGS